MEMKALNRIKVSVAIGRAPAIGPVLKRLAAKVVKGLTLPDSFSARDLDYAARGELERLFGTRGQMTSDGRFVIAIPPFLKEPSEWGEVLDVFGLTRKKNVEPDIFNRLKLLFPFAEDFIDNLQSKDEIRRFLNSPENIRDWLRLAQGVLRRIQNFSGEVTTLSQLGSDWFGDSKKLRSGSLRHQLVLILATLADYDPNDEQLVLNGMLIYDNPYTSAVTFSVPVVLHLKNGEVLDYPARYYEMGMAVQLPLETVLQIEYVEWIGKKLEVTTSENAAPFSMMVSGGKTCVYTAGYPNLAVKIFLHKIAECRVECIHEGDVDLDGFRIAAEVGKWIPVVKVVASEVVRNAPKEAGIKITPEQMKRIRSHIENPKWTDFEYNEELRMLIECGRWFEQESFGRKRGKMS